MRGQKTGGRKAGTPNKATAEVMEAAQKYTTEAVDTLAHIMRQGTPDTARAAAANALLDRGHGKPAQEQVLKGDPNAPLTVQIVKFSEIK